MKKTEVHVAICVSGLGLPLWQWLLVLMLIVYAGLSQAAQVHIKATYRNGKLQIDSPAAPYCKLWPELCAAAQTLPIPITYTKSFDPRGGQSARLYLKPPPVRTGMLASETGGDTYPFDFKFLVFGMMTRSAYSIYNPAMFSFYGCSVLRVQRPPVDGDWATVVLQMSDGGGACYSDRSSFPSPYNVYVKEMGAAYQLVLPSLGSMKPGRYSATLSYRVGDGGDMDLGSRLNNLSDTALDVLLELTVTRDIHVEFPQGSDRAVLEPPGGWSRWPGGKPPKQLARDIPFRVTIDGPFGIYVKCQYAVSADSCGLRNQHADEVPVSTRLTLRSATSGGSSAVKVILPTLEHDKLVLEPAQPLLNQPGTLHFSVESEGVEQMVKHPGSTYQGQVTVVFDAWI